MPTDDSSVHVLTFDQTFLCRFLEEVVDKSDNFCHARKPGILVCISNRLDVRSRQRTPSPRQTMLNRWDIYLVSHRKVRQRYKKSWLVDSSYVLFVPLRNVTIFYFAFKHFLFIAWVLRLFPFFWVDQAKLVLSSKGSCEETTFLHHNSCNKNKRSKQNNLRKPPYNLYTSTTPLN